MKLWSILFFLMLICLPVNTFAQRREPKGESTIGGRVIFADTGRPVRRALVRLLKNLNYPPVKVTPANVRGEFRFSEVAAGSYFVMAEDPASVSAGTMILTEFGLNADTETEHTRVTVDGKGATRCEVRLKRGGTIRGTILYADKEPVTRGEIALFRRWNGGTSPLFSEPVKTNDRGMYRVDGLPDGEYFVGVVDGKGKAGQVDFRDLRGFVTAFYPGVSSIVDAKPIQIQSGSEVTGINITLGEDHLHRISGVVRFKNGERAGGALMSLRRKEEPRIRLSFDNLFRTITAPGSDDDLSMLRDIALMTASLPPSLTADKDGSWKVEDLPSGTYVLTVHAVSVAKDKPDKKVSGEGDPEDPLATLELEDEHLKASKQIELTVKDEDLRDIVIELSEGGRISGSIVTPDPSLPRVRIAVDHPAAEVLRILPTPAKANGTFVIESVPGGEVRLDVSGPAESNLYLKSITIGSQDLMRNPLRVEEGVDIAGVQITLAKGLASVRGRVLFNDNGGLAGGSGVLFVRADPALWHLESSRSFALANADGEYEVLCPPGDYFVVTWPAGGQPGQSLEVFLRAQAPAAKRISLQSEEAKQLDLTVAKPKK
jgi:hypothetical protein